MRKHISKSFRDKREGMVYVVVFLWIVLGILAAIYEADFEHTAVYYLSLTAFVSSFIWGESIRPTTETSIFFQGKSSRREVMLYIVILLWLALGVFGIVTDSDLLSISAYFASLSPFVSAYVIGETYKPISASQLRPKLDGTSEPALQKPKEDFKKETDPDTQKALQNKKADPSLPEPDVSDEDMST